MRDARESGSGRQRRTTWVQPFRLAPLLALLVGASVLAQDRRDALAPSRQQPASEGQFLEAIRPQPVPDGAPGTISRGEVILYGQSVQPPYRFTIRNEALYLNGVRIDPPILPPWMWRTTPIVVTKEIEQDYDLTERIYEKYEELVDQAPQDGPHAALLEYLTAHEPLVERAHWEGEAALYVLSSTGYDWGMSFQDDDRPRDELQERRQSLLETMQSYHRRLNAGALLVIGCGAVATIPPERVEWAHQQIARGLAQRSPATLGRGVLSEELVREALFIQDPALERRGSPPLCESGVTHAGPPPPRDPPPDPPRRAINETPSEHVAIVVAPARFDLWRQGESVFVNMTGVNGGQKYPTIEHMQSDWPGINPVVNLRSHMQYIDGTSSCGVLLHVAHGGPSGNIQLESYGGAGTKPEDARAAAFAQLDEYRGQGWKTRDGDGDARELGVWVQRRGYYSIDMLPPAVSNPGRATGLGNDKPLVYIAGCYGSLICPAYVGKDARVAVGNVGEIDSWKNKENVQYFFRRMNGWYGQASRTVEKARQYLHQLNADGNENTTLAPSVISVDAPCPIKTGDKVTFTLETKCQTQIQPEIEGLMCTIENEKWLDEVTVEGECTAPPPPGAFAFVLVLHEETIHSANNTARLDGNTDPLNRPNAYGPAHDHYKVVLFCPCSVPNGNWDETSTGANGYSHLLVPRRSILDDFELEDDCSIRGFNMQFIWDSGDIGLGQGINLRVYGDAGGQPDFDNLICDLVTSNYREEATGESAFGRPIVRAAVDVESPDLPAGIYWLDMQIVSPENGFQLTSGSFCDGNGILAECWLDYEDYGRMPGSDLHGCPMDVNFQLGPPGDDCYAPLIVAQPMDQTVCVDDPVSFRVEAAGTLPLSYQWRKDGVDIPDATDETYTIDAVQPEDQADYDAVLTNECGTETCSAATLTIDCGCDGPQVVAHPQDSTVCVGEMATFTIAATGDAPLSYQWLCYGEDIPGETDDSLTVGPVGAEDYGLYSVRVENACDATMSDLAALIVLITPIIVEQPQSQAVCPGDAATFTVTVDDDLPTDYQWRKFDPDLNEWVDIPGANDDSYTIDPVTSEDAGDYDVVLSNDCSASVSDPATLTVGLPEPLDNGVIRVSFTDYGTSGVRFAEPPVAGDIAWLDVSGDSQVYSWEGNLHYDDGAGPANHLLADSNEFAVDSPACRLDNTIVSESHNGGFAIVATHWLDGATLTTQLEITNTFAGDLADVDFAWMMDADLVLPEGYEEEPCCPGLPWLGYGSGRWNGPAGDGVQNNLNPCAGVRPANMAVVHSARMDGTVVPDEWTVSNPVGFQGATCAFDGEVQAEPRFLFETPFDNTQGMVGYDQDLGIVTNFRIDTWEAGATHTFTYTLTFRSSGIGQGGTDGTPVEPIEIRRIPPP